VHVRLSLLVSVNIQNVSGVEQYILAQAPAERKSDSRSSLALARPDFCMGRFFLFHKYVPSWLVLCISYYVEKQLHHDP
jgi:hypothetical protein